MDTTCPICKKKVFGTQCQCCGYDLSTCYEECGSLSPIPEQLPSMAALRKQWKNEASRILRCDQCGGERIVFSEKEMGFRCSRCRAPIGTLKAVSQLKDDLAKIDLSLKKKEEDLAERDRELNRLRDNAKRTKEELRKLKSEAQVKDRALNTLTEKDREINRLQDNEKNLQEQLLKLQDELQGKDLALSNKETALTEKDLVLQDLQDKERTAQEELRRSQEDAQEMAEKFQKLIADFAFLRVELQEEKKKSPLQGAMDLLETYRASTDAASKSFQKTRSMVDEYYSLKTKLKIIQQKLQQEMEKSAPKEAGEHVYEELSPELQQLQQVEQRILDRLWKMEGNLKVQSQEWGQLRVEGKKAKEELLILHREFTRAMEENGLIEGQTAKQKLNGASQNTKAEGDVFQFNKTEQPLHPKEEKKKTFFGKMFGGEK